MRFTFSPDAKREGCNVQALVRCLDLFCCEGGAGMGYHRAGMDVVGVDIGIDMRGQGVIVSAHEHTEKNQRSVGRVDAVREVRVRTVGIAQEWQAAKPDMRRLPEQGQREPAASIGRTASRLARWTVGDKRRTYPDHAFSRRSYGVNARQGRVCL